MFHRLYHMRYPIFALLMILTLLALYSGLSAGPSSAPAKRKAEEVTLIQNGSSPHSTSFSIRSEAD
ncbi:hypothetical protein LOK74_17170 [Brevibacillus humidisoli]|uniref:hypothetical protein n=1 Tax=Brevibacillus humidisoli TaxID=2895522 RepID=UPI001E3F704C|nr:hypothetical protein [Brevibacillus humidisoli]UFJ39770.1 hypothetical protein LOK74_17170 [Brevibacillus humidisoli]